MNTFRTDGDGCNCTNVCYMPCPGPAGSQGLAGHMPSQSTAAIMPAAQFEAGLSGSFLLGASENTAAVALRYNGSPMAQRVTGNLIVQEIDCIL